MALTGSVVGTHVAATGTTTVPFVNRTVPVADLANTFYLTSTDATDSPLPIQLVDFAATIRNDVVDLSWSTASELNNDFFTIERATNIKEFEVIGLSIDGAGTTRERKDYRTVNKYPMYGRSYYRLKQTDFDGKFSYSNIQVVDYEGPKFAGLKAYPNPSDGNKLTVLVTGLKEQTAVPIQIYNVPGQMIFDGMLEVNTPGTLKHEIEFGNPLRAGVYIIKAGPTLQLTQKIFIH